MAAPNIESAAGIAPPPSRALRTLPHMTVGTTRRKRRVVAVLVLVAACTGPGAVAGAVDAPGGSDAPAPLVIAHRGASADAPEHTFAAYDLGVEAGADVIECDLQLTKDEVLVCVHDTTVDRTTGGAASGRVDSFTLEELRAMDFGSWFGPEFAGAAIVPFEEQLRCYGGGDVRFYAETKAPSEYGGRMEPALVSLLRRLDLIPERLADRDRSPVIVQSFELDSLAAVRELAPTLPTAWLWVVPPPESDADPSPAQVADVMAPTASYILNVPQIVDLYHQQGKQVHTWTVDDPVQMQQLLDLGVDGIFTNRPATLRELVDGRPADGAAVRRGCPGIAGTVGRAAAEPRVEPGAEPHEEPVPVVVAAEANGSDADDADWVPVTVAVLTLAAVAGIIVWVLGRGRAR